MRSRKKTHTGVGEKIRAARTSLGWTQEDLAEKADINKISTVSEIERGFKPSPKTFSRIAEAINTERQRRGKSSLDLECHPDHSSPSKAHATECPNGLDGYWLEIIQEASPPEYSVGRFHQHNHPPKYDGWSYDPKGNLRYKWYSFILSWDKQHNRIIYSYDYGEQRGDGFGAIELKPAKGDKWTASNGYFIDIEGNRATLRRLKMERLEEAMKRHSWKNDDVDEEENRVEFIRFLIARGGPAPSA